MKRIAIQDANILIDLIKTNLFDYCLALDFEFTTTDIILNELYDEQIASIQPHIISGKFIIIEISEEELVGIQILSKEDSRLSEQDWSAIYYAEQKDAILLSGDRRLKSIAEAKGLTVFGIIWILDLIIDNHQLSKDLACAYLKDLMLKNKWLPAKECEKRILLWCAE